MSTSKKWFLGWTNIKWTITELVKIFSSAPSYFSKKRIESATAFIIGQAGMIYYITQKISTMDMMEMTMWAGIEFTIAGWTVYQIEKNKKQSTNAENQVEPQEQQEQQEQQLNS